MVKLEKFTQPTLPLPHVTRDFCELGENVKIFDGTCERVNIFCVKIDDFKHF